MQILSDHFSLTEKSPVIFRILREGDLFLDIETTGLSRARHQIYLIGCAQVDSSQTMHVTQFFADQPSEEASLLEKFYEFLTAEPPARVITFNGSGFDLPFLAARAEKYEIPIDLSDYGLLDIYREVTKRKRLFNLANYRQKTIEQFLCLPREDKFSGGELITVYKNYVKAPDAGKARLLLLHNYEDVRGMADLLAIFSYEAFLRAAPIPVKAALQSYTDIGGTPAEELIVTLRPPYPLPGKLSCEHPLTGAYLRASGDTAHLRVPLYHRMARLYYLDYKNYYYLPGEDMAVHKSVAASVDKAHREKAAPENCYTQVAVDAEFLSSGRLSEYVSHVLGQFLAL